MIKALSTVAHIALVLALPAALILAPMYLFITPEFIHYEYSQPGFPQSFRFTPEERLAISDAILEYVRGRSSREQLEAVRTSDGAPALQEREIDHLTDVRQVMDMLFNINAVAIAVVVVACLCLWVVARPRLPLALEHGVYLSAGLIALVVGSAAVDFDAFFTTFHRIFFAEGSWLFDLADTLIQLYPLSFWMDAVWRMGAVIAGELLIVYLLARLGLHKARALRPQAP